MRVLGGGGRAGAAGGGRRTVRGEGRPRRGAMLARQCLGGGHGRDADADLGLLAALAGAQPPLACSWRGDEGRARRRGCACAFPGPPPAVGAQGHPKPHGSHVEEGEDQHGDHRHCRQGGAAGVVGSRQLGGGCWRRRRRPSIAYPASSLPHESTPQLLRRGNSPRAPPPRAPLGSARPCEAPGGVLRRQVGEISIEKKRPNGSPQQELPHRRPQRALGVATDRAGAAGSAGHRALLNYSLHSGVLFQSRSVWRPASPAQLTGAG